MAKNLISAPISACLAQFVSMCVSACLCVCVCLGFLCYMLGIVASYHVFNYTENLWSKLNKMAQNLIFGLI